MSEITSLSEKIDELIFWTKFAAFPTFIALLRDALRDDVDKLVYDLSDGERTTRDIAELISSTGRRIHPHYCCKSMAKMGCEEFGNASQKSRTL